MSAHEIPSTRLAARAVLTALVLATSADPVPAALTLDLVVREAEVIAAGAIAGPSDEFGLAPFRVTRLYSASGLAEGERASAETAVRPPGRSTTEAPAFLAVRVPRTLPIGQDVLLFLVADPLTRSLGGLTPLDPEAGVVMLDGRAGLPADILAAVELELDPPAEPALRVAAYLRLVGAGDLLTTHAASRIAQDPEWRELVPPHARAAVLRLLESGRMGEDATCAVVDLADALWSRDTAATLVELVAAGTPPTATECAAAALSRHRDPSVVTLLRDALHRAPDASAPALLRLVAAAGAVELLDEVHSRLSASSAPLRLKAIAACGDLGQPSSLPLLDVLASSGDPATRDAARSAADRIRSGR